MPIRDIIAAAIVFGSLPICFRNPFVGLLVFTWLAYMRVQDLCWSFAREMRFSYIVGIVMIAGLIFNERKRPFCRLDLRTGLMIALVVLGLFSVASGYRQDEYTWTRYLEFVKIVMIALITTGLTDSRKRLDLLVLTIALSLGFFGFKGGLFGLATGGAVIHRGPGGMMEDNNDFALALVIAVPMLFYLARIQEKPLYRKGLLAATGLTCITIILTHSRGGFLSLVAVAMVIAWRSKKLLQASMGLVLAAILFLVFAPEHVKERLYTIKDYRQDSSAMGRIVAWQAALNMVAVHPMLGVGMRSFQKAWLENPRVWVEGQPPFGEARVAHNSYLQIWAESGTPAFFCYLLLLLSSFIVLGRMRRRSETGRAPPWLYNYTLMFEASLVGFLVGAFFLNRGHFDLVYQILAIITVMFWLSRRESAVLETEDSSLPQLQVPARPSWPTPGRAGGRLSGVPGWR